MIIRRQSTATIATSVAVAVALACASAPAAAAEVDELRAAVQALSQRIEQLESKSKEVEATNDRQTDQIAQARQSVGEWVPRFQWKGDLRYRNENIVQEAVTKDRNRDRIRLRAGFFAKVNDTTRVEVQLASSEGGDPRSSNQTLTGENTRKPIELDLAYAEWSPNAQWKLTGGKMRYPWVRPGQSVLFDGDINPEGVAVNYTTGGFFASTFLNRLEERSAAAETNMAGGQAGYRFDFSSTTRLTVGASYFDLAGAQGKNPFYNASSNGNTTTTSLAVCQGAAAAPCLLYDYELYEGFGELTTTVAGKALALYVDYFKNEAADNGLDTAYSAGVMLGRASNPNTWEVGYVYQHVEKDALYGQFIDSDFGGGNTDAEGSILKAGYAFARNWALNLTYFLNDTNMDRSVVVGGRTIFDRDYKRLQVDLNWRY